MVDKTSQRILTAASDLFFTYGYSRVSMDEVATALRMSKKTIYKHFSGKQDLLLATMEQFYGDIQVGIDQLRADPALDHAGRLGAFISLLGQKMAVIRRAQSDLRQGAPEVWEYVQDRREQVILSELRRLIEEGIEHGVLRSDINPDLLGTLVSIWMQAVANSDILSQYPVSAADLLDTMLDILLHGMMQPALTSP